MGTSRDNVDWDAQWAELHTAIGVAISAWSALEHALSEAFAIVLQVPKERAERLFFVTHTFGAKQALLAEAIQSCNFESTVEKTKAAIFMSASKKATKFASTRNKLAHSRPLIAAKGNIVLGGIVGPNVLSDNLDADLDQILTVKAIRESAGSFRSLARLIKLATHEDEKSSLDKILEQIRDLPPSPYSDSLGLRVAATHEPPEPTQL